MWNPLISLFRLSARHEEVLNSAEFFLNSNRALMGNFASSSVPAKDQQLKHFNSNCAAIFDAYDTLANHAPLQAIRSLLELEKSLKPHAQASFWSTAKTRIPASLQQSGPDIKETVYRYILDHAHKGQITDFMMSQHADFGALLAFPNKTDATDLIATFLSHAQPKPLEFLEVFKPQFEEIYALGLANKLPLTKKILKACNPFDGKEKQIPLPDYVREMRDDQIKGLIERIIDIHSRDNADYRKINNCLQDLETLKAGNTNLLGKVKTDKTEKSELRLYLYKLERATPHHNPSDTLYILAGKIKNYASPTDSGKISTILATTDLKMVTKAFATLPYNADTKAAVEKLALAYTLPTYQITSNYKTGFQPSLKLHPTFCTVSQLTDWTKGVDLGHVQVTRPHYRDILPVEHHQQRAIQ